MRCLILALVCVLSQFSHAAHLGFQATSVEGQAISVDEGQLFVVCFLGTECPMARAYAKTLSELESQFASQGVRVVGVMSNLQDSPEDVAQYIENLDVRFPIVHDTDQRIADLYAAQRTPEVFLLDDELLLRYHGRIDNQFAPGVARQAATRSDLQAAIEQLLAGKPVKIPNTPALGCIIGRPKTIEDAPSEDTASLTFSRDISRVLARNCIECHRSGEIGPFSMEEYDEVVGWADTMLETIEDHRMPPWHASPEHGSFSNARVMSEEDKQMLRDWVEGGLAQGDPADLPEPIQQPTGWQLSRQPDHAFPMRDRPFIVPADGVVEYQYYVVDPGFEQDVWVSEAQVVPGQRNVVHHAIVYVRPPDGSTFRGVGWLTAYVPGQRLQLLPKGYARKIPAGSKLVFQMHYTPVGSEQADTTKVGLILAAPDEVTHEVFTIAALEQELAIPPEEAAHQVSASIARQTAGRSRQSALQMKLPAQGQLLAVTPHMHFRGKSFELFARDQALGTDTILLDVPNYDFNWQHTYFFSEPIDLGALAELRFDATFDNSSANPFNPDPAQWVNWGDQTSEEMAVAFFEVAESLTAPAAVHAGSKSESVSAADSKKIDAYVARFMASMDANGDGRIKESEAPIVVRKSFGLERWDLDADGSITEAEVRQAAERKFR